METHINRNSWKRRLRGAFHPWKMQIPKKLAFASFMPQITSFVGINRRPRLFARQKPAIGFYHSLLGLHPMPGLPRNNTQPRTTHVLADFGAQRAIGSGGSDRHHWHLQNETAAFTYSQF
jgi:hypothetical protein